jgi:deoxyhypusine synthase
MSKEQFLTSTVEQVDITSFDARPILQAMRGMSFSARETARAAEVLSTMVRDPQCSILLTIAGSAGAAGCLAVFADLLRYNLADAVVATGASIVDMDFFEALGFRHYQGTPQVDDRELRRNYIDRIYDTYIDEGELQSCDRAVKEVADALPPGVYSSRGFIREMGRYLSSGKARKKGSLVQTAYELGVPVFCPAFSDSSAGFGLVLHQTERPEAHVAIDSVRDFRELTQLKIRAHTTGLFMIGGGVPKNFAQDTVVCAEVLGQEVPMHKYAVQITVADVRDGACSSSTLKEASSWGKVDSRHGQEQMVFAEATTVLPLIASAVYHQGDWRKRPRREYSKLFE